MARDPYLVIEWSDRKTDARGWLVIVDPNVKTQFLRI